MCEHNIYCPECGTKFDNNLIDNGFKQYFSIEVIMKKAKNPLIFSKKRKEIRFKQGGFSSIDEDTWYFPSIKFMKGGVMIILHTKDVFPTFIPYNNILYIELEEMKEKKIKK